jgi:hypothetical protein
VAAMWLSAAGKTEPTACHTSVTLHVRANQLVVLRASVDHKTSGFAKGYPSSTQPPLALSCLLAGFEVFLEVERNMWA